MDVTSEAAETGRMDATTHEKIEALLAQARDMTQRTLGETPAAVVAEVFRQLCLEREYAPLPDEESDSVRH